MSKKTMGLILFTVVLGAFYIYYFTDLFRPKSITIDSQILPQKRRGNQPPALTVLFALDRKYKLTSVKVVRADDYQTNKYPHALWHMVTDSNSAPINSVTYGAPISGMKSSVPRVSAKPLEANVSYLLLLEAGQVKGEKNFQPRTDIIPASEAGRKRGRR